MKVYTVGVNETTYYVSVMIVIMNKQEITEFNDIHCSLCSMTFDSEDSLYKERIARHTIWHSKAQVQHRNTTQGEPTFDRTCQPRFRSLEYYIDKYLSKC